MNIRDRIRELRRVPASELRPSPHNWRMHSPGQLDAIKGILAEVGYAGAALARELPDGSLELIDGHARAEVSGAAMVPVLVLDVDEAEAKKILATYDPIGAMAGADAAKLDALLRDVQTGNEALAGMLEGLAEKAGVIPGEGNDINEVYQGLPEFEQEDQTAEFSIRVNFDSFADVKDFAQRIGQNLTEKTRSIWHPYKEPVVGKDYTAEDSDDES